MAEQSFPFETQSTSEVQYSYLFRLLADTGVAGASTSADLRPYGDSTGMFVKVPTGVALVRGFYYLNDSLLTLPVAAAGQSARIDSVVLRLDPAANTVVAAVKAGQAGGAAPALTQTDSGVWEVRLADVQVPASASTVTAGQVTDRRSYTSLPWGEWTSDGRPNAPIRGKAGYNQTTGRPEYWTGNTWADFSQATTDAGQLTSGILDDARIGYGTVQAWRGNRPVDAPVTTGNNSVNGNWDDVRQPGVYRTFGGNTNGNAPAGAGLYGTLAVLGAGANIESRTQVYSDTDGGLYWRTAWNGTDYNTWRSAATSTALQAETTARQTLQADVNTRVSNYANSTHMAAGTATVTTMTKNSDGSYSGTVDVTWPQMALVSCIACARSGDSRGVNASVTNQTNTGARLVVTRPNNTATGVDWVAVGN